MEKTTILNGELGIVGRFLRLQYGRILGVVVGGTVRTVQAIRAHEAATESYSQDQSQIKANADLITTSTTGLC